MIECLNKFMNALAKLSKYIKESVAELRKVSWPTKKQTTNYSLLVIGISVAVAAFLGICDYLFADLIERLIK